MKQKNILLSTVGDNVKALRKEFGWTQAEIARRAGFKSSYIGAIERGEVNLSYLSLMKISKVLGVKASLLVIENNN